MQKSPRKKKKRHISHLTHMYWKFFIEIGKDWSIFVHLFFCKLWKSKILTKATKTRHKNCQCRNIQGSRRRQCLQNLSLNINLMCERWVYHKTSEFHLFYYLLFSLTSWLPMYWKKQYIIKLLQTVENIKLFSQKYSVKLKLVKVSQKNSISKLLFLMLLIQIAT